MEVCARPTSKRLAGNILLCRERGERQEPDGMVFASGRVVEEARADGEDGGAWVMV